MKTRDAFIAAKLAERIPRPPYFRHMEKVNLEGGMPAGKGEKAVPLLDPKKFAAEMKRGIVIDTRDPEAFAAGHVPGSFNVWLKGLPVFGGWLADENSRVYLVLRDMTDLHDAVLHLSRIGIDGVEAALAGGFAAWRDAGMPLARFGTIDARQLEAELATHTVLDVRDDSEFEEEGHIPDARHLYVGYLDAHLDRIESDLQKKKTIAVTCSVGHRSGVAASILERRGLRNIENVLGGMTAWNELGLPTRKDREHTITTPDIEGVRK